MRHLLCTVAPFCRSWFNCDDFIRHTALFGDAGIRGGSRYDHAVELEKEYKAALQDVNTTRDAIGKLKPRKGSADLTLIKRVHSSVIPRAFTQLRGYPVSSELRGTCFCHIHGCLTTTCGPRVVTKVAHVVVTAGATRY